MLSEYSWMAQFRFKQRGGDGGMDGEQIKSTSEESWGGKVGVYACVHARVRAQILMHGQKQASLISTLSEGQGVQELDSKSMTQSKMSAAPA